MVVTRCFTETQRKKPEAQLVSNGAFLLIGGWVKEETFLFNQRSAWLCFLNWVKKFKTFLISTVKKIALDFIFLCISFIEKYGHKLLDMHVVKALKLTYVETLVSGKTSFWKLAPEITFV